MFRVRMLIVLVALVGLCTTWAGGQEKAKEKEASAKMRGQLPQNWGRLGLTDEQKQRVYKIQNEYGTKIDALQKQIEELRTKMREERDNVLTDAQRARLREIASSKAPAEKSKEKSKSP